MTGLSLRRAIVYQFATILVLVSAGVANASFVPLEARVRASRSAAVPSAPRLIDCGVAATLQVGDSVEGSTIGLASSVDSYGCSEWSETGGEVVYALSVPEATMFEIRLNADCDLDVVLLSSCDPDTGCLLVADTGVRTTEPTAGEFFIVIDGYEGAACDFTLEVVAMGPAGVDQAACDGALPLACEGGNSIGGDTCSGADHVRALGCEEFPAAGTERWFQVTLGPGGELAADVAVYGADAVLWILGGCGEAAECLAYSDSGGSGERELVNYSNDGSEDRTVFLVVDSYGPGSCGEYAGDVFCDGRVPVRPVSWSVLKARTAGEER